ncbi:MAG TPA: class I SAM-dependent methyltransferase [Chloroflexota bacterium]|jgi:ubiquinone/menaquinone biosynthesis C-methylase UbiE|nr:class I SAM-dependent methyltransferase [Chloroflexota bacterium]
MSATTAVLNAQAAKPAASFNFEWFSSLPAYRAINREQLEAFLAQLDLPQPWLGVDVACGLGLMTELCHEIARKIGASIQRTVCIDLDREALELAREKLASYPARLIQSVGERLPIRSGTASYVVIGNGIHNFAYGEKLDLMREAFRVLNGGARLFFNSSFYDGAYVEGTEDFWVGTVRRAMRLIQRWENSKLEVSGKKPEAMQALTPEGYVKLAREAGFTDVQYQEQEMRCDQEFIEAISDYWSYSQGALHYRYPAEVACPAMRQAARELFLDPDWDRKFPGMEENGKRFIPRRFLWVTARKP